MQWFDLFVERRREDKRGIFHVTAAPFSVVQFDDRSMSHEDECSTGKTLPGMQTFFHAKAPMLRIIAGLSNVFSAFSELLEMPRIFTTASWL